MIDPIVSLAFSLQANKGAYALLLGSGVSRSAGIPTGWEITLELVKKIAAASGDEIGSSAEEWFRSKYQKEPDYSVLLDQLCKSATERQQYLKKFFEPSEEEREEELKQPTAAHHAIAELMAEGYVRVVVTTNFDRLLEQALEAKGIVPVVISNSDQVQGMLPLVHQKHCVLKVHGDYLDTRIMNTESELAAYTPQVDRLLDQIFDEFGVIYCGWSGEWDPALRSAIVRAPTRRFSSYWATRSAMGGDVQKIVTDRGIVSIPIEGANEFFSTLSENLTSLREFDRPHPISVQSAVASLKRYLAEDRYRIRLHDLLMSVVGDARVRWQTSGLAIGTPPATDEEVVTRVKAYDASMEILLPLAVELGKWAKQEHIYLISEILEALCYRPTHQGSYIPLWQELSRYPATLYLYAVGLSALKSNNFEVVGHLLSRPIMNGSGGSKPAVATLLPICLVTHKEQLWPLFEGQRRHTPLSDWLETKMRMMLAPGSTAEHYNDPFAPIFDQFELIGAVAYQTLMREHRSHTWVPIGRWAWRLSEDGRGLERLKADLEAQGEKSNLLQLGIFKNGATEAQDALDEVIEFVNNLNFF